MRRPVPSARHTPGRPMCAPPTPQCKATTSRTPRRRKWTSSGTRARACTGRSRCLSDPGWG
eukprot:7262443-Pyramimonas_sp.AAC.1